MKKYIRDNGKVRLCDSNVAQMNIFEVMYYHRNIMIGDIVGVMYYHRNIMIEDIAEVLNTTVELIANLLMVLVSPFAYPFMAYKRLCDAKKEVKRCINE